MYTSLFLAQIFGIYFLILAIAMFANPQRFLNLIGNFRQDGPILFLGNIISLIIGIILIVIHNVWVLGWPVLITILAWLIFIRSVIYLLFPNVMQKMMGYINSINAVRIIAVVLLILALIFLYVGFV